MGKNGKHERGILKMVPPIIREKVIFLYYEKGEKITAIAEKLGISTASAFRIVQGDKRYASEKERRKEELKKKKNEYSKEYKKQKKNKEKELVKEIHEYFENNYSALDYSFCFIEEKIAKIFNLPFWQVCEILRKHPLYNVLEKARKSADEEMINRLHQTEINLTVKRRKISKQSLFELTRNAYDYDHEKEKFIFNETCGKRPIDIPKSYSVHTNLYTSYKAALINELKNKIEEEKRESEIESKIVNGETCTY